MEKCKIKDHKLFSKIVFISQLPLTKKIKEDFYISDLQNEGFDVEYWDASSLLHPIELKDSIFERYCKSIETYKVLSNELCNLNISETLVVIQVQLAVDMIKLYRNVIKLGFKTAFFDRPGFTVNLTGKRSIISRVLTWKSYRNFLDKVVCKLALASGYVKAHDYVFAAGADALERNRESSTVISINHFDYDDYLKNNANYYKLVNEPYAVFLDEYLPHHPDFKMLGMPVVSADEYYFKMNHFFDVIEKKYDLEVIIAAHPKADYSSNPFSGRKTFKYKTANLIKYSEFAISHASTSSGFCAIYQKPIVFAYFGLYKKIYEHTCYRYMKAIATDFLTTPIDIDTDYLKWDRTSNWDESVFCNYVLKYLSTEETLLTCTPRLMADKLLKMVN